MKAFRRGFGGLVPVILLMLLISGIVPMVSSGSLAPTVQPKTVIRSLIINEIAANGSASSEWVELYNPNEEWANYTDLKLSDQDGHEVNLSAAGLTHIPPGAYVVVHMGRGTNDTSFSGNRADVYAWFKGNILNDAGDDIIIYNGTYGSTKCQYFDYVAYYSGGRDFDVDQPPIGSGLKFYLYGRGKFGYAPAPGKDESISLVPNGVDNDNASDWYVTRYINTPDRYDNSITPGERNANILQVTVKDIAPVNQTQGTEVAVISYTMNAIGGNVEIYKTFVTLFGTIEDSELQSGLYQDNGDGHWDVGDQAVITGYAVYSGHATSFATPNIYVQIGRPKTFFITVKLEDDASIFHNYSLLLTDMDTGTWSDNVHTNEVYIVNTVQTKYVKISPIDQVSPYVVNVTFDRPMPLGPGKHNVTIEFNEPMDTNIQPNVSFGIYGYEYKIKGNWKSDKIWIGDFTIDPLGPHNILRLNVSGAKDVFWNVLIPYSTTFEVDTEKPFIKDIKYNALSPYPIGFPVNITVIFSENVTGVLAMVTKNNKAQIIIDVHRHNGTVYYLNFITQSNWKSGNYTIEIYNASDSAGNEMDLFKTNFTVDTYLPVIAQVEYKMNVVEGENVTFYVLPTDNNGIRRVWAVYEYNGQLVTVDAQRSGEYWTFQVVGGAVKPGTVTITIYVQDIAGNVYKDEEVITVIPWWQAMWWLWVIIAILVGFVLYLIYDYIRSLKLREQLGEELVSESILVRMSKALKNMKTKGSKKQKKKRKKVKETEEEEEEEEEEEMSGYTIPPAPPPQPPVQQTMDKKEIPEVPYEDEYFEEETIERED